MANFVLSLRLSACAMSVLMLVPSLTLVPSAYAEGALAQTALQSERPIMDSRTIDSCKKNEAESISLPIAKQNDANHSKVSEQAVSPGGQPDKGSPASRHNDASPIDHDFYPSIGEMEKIVFDRARPDLPVAERLNQLEQATCHRTFSNLSLFDRSANLQDILLWPHKQKMGHDDPTQAPEAVPASSSQEGDEKAVKLNEVWQQPCYQIAADPSALAMFALELVNQKRQAAGLMLLQPDPIASKVAAELSGDLCKRNCFSHLNRYGENPDVRYTKAGGCDYISESLAVAPSPRLNRALVARIILEIDSHQDERSSLMSPAANYFGFSIGMDARGDTAIACLEVVTKHAQITPVPQRCQSGGHLEIGGTVLPPYRFQKVTLAWGRDIEASTTEAEPTQVNPNPVSTAAQFEQGEELPYFPPVDYVAYEKSVPHDRSKLYGALKIAAVVGVIGGGVVVPGLAAAAPLILLIPLGRKPPISNVPIRAGIKVHGLCFFGDIPCSDGQKSGLCYLTVWATKGHDYSSSVPISRRAIMVTAQPAGAASNASASKGAVDGQKS